jgi:hypothetical protein
VAAPVATLRQPDWLRANKRARTPDLFPAAPVLFDRVISKTKYKLRYLHRQVEKPFSYEHVPRSYRLISLFSLSKIAMPNRISRTKSMHLGILQRTAMFILFSISALCFFALVAATIAIARHARPSRTATPPSSDFAQHLFAAAEAQNARVLHSFRHQNVNDIVAKASFGSDTQAHQSTASKPF